jgi:hypothetical protein
VRFAVVAHEGQHVGGAFPVGARRAAERPQLARGEVVALDQRVDAEDVDLAVV